MINKWNKHEFKTIALCLFIIVGAFLTTIFYTYTEVAAYQEKKHRESINDARKNLDSMISLLERQIKSIAQSPLVVNSIIDNEPYSVKSDIIKGIDFTGVKSKIIMTDYRGRIVASNTYEKNEIIYQSYWQKKTIKQGETYSKLTTRGLVISEPILFNGSIEGAIFSFFPTNSIENILTSKNNNYSTVLIDEKNNIVLVISNNLEGKEINLTNIEPSKVLSKQYDQNLVLASINNEPIHQGFLLNLIYYLAILMILIVLLFSIFSIKKLRYVNKNRQLGKNIDAQKEHIDKINKDNDKLNFIFNNTNEIIITVDLDNNIKEINRNAEKLIENLEKEKTIVENDGVLDERKLLIVSREHPILNEDSTIKTHESLYNINNRKKVIKWKKEAIKNEQGSITGFLYIGTNTTENYDSINSLRIIEHAIESVQDGIAILDVKDNLSIIYINPYLEKITGYSYHDVIEKDWTFTFGKETNKTSILSLSEAINLNETIKIEVISYKKNGRQFWSELSLSPIYNKIGMITHYLYTQKDITRKIENHKKLQEAISKAENSNKIKSEFLANMSHEIRTPMNAVIGLSNLCLMTDLSNQQRDYLEKIQGSGKLLLNIINDILDFSKIEAGKMKLEKTPFSVNQLSKTINSIIGNEAAKKRLYLDFNLSELSHRYFIGDEFRLQQVLINLIFNAIRFTERGSIYIQVKSLDKLNGKHGLEFTVKDSGIGMTEDQRKIVFDSFSQADNSNTRQYGGSGLGLTISKSLIEMMNGDINISSLINIGTTVMFKIYLPEASEQDISKIHSKNKRTEVIKKIVNNVDVLLVEDNIINQQIAKEILEKMGAVITIADNGERAVELVSKKDYSCVFMDIQMPVMDGYTATKEIRETLRLEKLPIIAMTANALPEDEARCLEFGMNDYISKPINIEKLASIFIKHVSKNNINNSTATVPLENQDTVENTNSSNLDTCFSSKKAIYNIESINVNSALKKLSGNEDLLNKLVEMFSKDHINDGKKITELVKENNYHEARSIAHTLKGVSGSIGMMKIFTHASALESAIKEKNYEHVDAHTKNLKDSLDQCFLELSQFTDTHGPLSNTT